MQHLYSKWNQFHIWASYYSPPPATHTVIGTGAGTTYAERANRRIQTYSQNTLEPICDVLKSHLICRSFLQFTGTRFMGSANIKSEAKSIQGTVEPPHSGVEPLLITVEPFPGNHSKGTHKHRRKNLSST
jgi:hypothetical protein